MEKTWGFFLVRHVCNTENVSICFVIYFIIFDIQAHYNNVKQA